MGDVTFTVQHRDSPDWLELCVDLWSMQSPGFAKYLIVDTSSTKVASFTTLDRLERRDNFSVADLGHTAFLHPSDMISDALDFAFATATTEYLFATHTDVFPRRRDVIGTLLNKCNKDVPVVGWEMSPRPRKRPTASSKKVDISAGVPGHACVLFHLPTARRLGLSWSIRKANRLFGTPRQRDPAYVGWPDTETCMGLMMKRNKVEAHWFGREAGAINQVTPFWEHARSMSPRPHLRHKLQRRHIDAFNRFTKQLCAWKASENCS